MNPQIPFFVFCLLIHGAIYLSSEQKDCLRRLAFGLVLMFMARPAWFGGQHLEASAGTLLQVTGLALQWAPYVLPLLSYLVYWRSSKA